MSDSDTLTLPLQYKVPEELRARLAKANIVRLKAFKAMKELPHEQQAERVQSKEAGQARRGFSSPPAKISSAGSPAASPAPSSRRFCKRWAAEVAPGTSLLDLPTNTPQSGELAGGANHEVHTDADRPDNTIDHSANRPNQHPARAYP